MYGTHVVRFCHVVHAGLERPEQRFVNLVVTVLVALAIGRAVKFEVVDRFTFRVAVCHVRVTGRIGSVRTVPCHIAAATMVLADLGRKLNAALSTLGRASVVDDKVRRRDMGPDYPPVHVYRC